LILDAIIATGSVIRLSIRRSSGRVRLPERFRSASSDGKSHLSELVGRVHYQRERVTETVHGKPSAILIAPEDLEALEESSAIMRDAATMNRLAESDAELARDEYVSAEELAETMGRRR
jgi:antitoxin YefM